MSNRIFILMGVVALVMGFCIAPASADPLATSLLYKDGQTITELEDNDWESILETNINGIVERGEYFYGMFEITDVRDAWPDLQPPRPRQTNMFTGVFVAEVGLVDTTNPLFSGGATISLKPAPAAAWTTVGLAAPTSAGTMAVVYSDPDGPQNMVNPNAATQAAALATATNGTKLWEIGFTGGGTDPTEFWVGEVNSANILALKVLMYQASLNVTVTEPAATGITLVKHNGLSLLNPSFPNVLSQVQFDGKLESLSAGKFQIRTDSDFYVKAVPEPSTLALLVLGGLALLAGSWCRRRG